LRQINPEGERETLARDAEGARKRAAVETYVRHEAALRRTARRYSLCADDADDAVQRGLEILLAKAPSEDPRELIRWTQTVVKHEALAVRRERERILAGPAAAKPAEGREDWVALLPSAVAGPAERAERAEAIARSREALQTLKPQELRALSLLAEGYSYLEIGEITGFSQTKINRCLAEGRERFRRVLSSSEDGSRCEDLRPLLSAFCDGEVTAEETATLREHLRACGTCRATLRAYRAAPAAAAALAPALPLSRSLLDRAQEAFSDLAARLGGGASDSALSQVAGSGGSRGAGIAALAKVLAICAGGAGAATACVATGLVPAPLKIEQERTRAPVIERRLDPVIAAAWSDDGSGVEYETAPEQIPTEPDRVPRHSQPAPAQPLPQVEPETAAGGGVEFAPEPAPPAAPVSTAPADPTSGSPAGEFGP
jgi:RNA polymerase sigma factor (sigma-70 family)